MKNWKTAAVLTLVVLGLGGVATWDEWQTKKEEKEKETSNKLTNFNPDDVVSFEFLNSGDQSQGGDKIANPGDASKSESTQASLEKKEDKWFILAPVATEADQQVIKDLLKNLSDYKYETEISDQRTSWGQYGLDQPRRRLDLKLKDGGALTVYVGLNTPVGYSAYVSTSASDKVFAGSQYIATSLGKTLFELREKKIIQLSSFEVDSFELISGKKTQASAKRSDGKWILPDNSEADPTPVNNFLDDLLAAKATEFIDAPSKDLAKAKDKDLIAQVNLKSGKGDFAIKLMSHSGSTYLVLNDQRFFKVPDELKSKIQKTNEDFRNKRIFSFQSPNVESVEIDGTRYKRVVDEWYLEEDANKFNAEGKFQGKEADKPASKSNVRSLLVDLEYSKADQMIAKPESVKRPESPKHRFVLTFKSSSGNEPLTIDVWQAADSPDSIYLKHSANPALFKAKASLISSASAAVKVPAGDELSLPPPTNAP